MMTKTIRIGNISYLVQEPIADHINYLEGKVRNLEASLHSIRDSTHKSAVVLRGVADDALGTKTGLN